MYLDFPGKNANGLILILDFVCRWKGGDTKDYMFKFVIARNLYFTQILLVVCSSHFLYSILIDRI